MQNSIKILLIIISFVLTLLISGCSLSKLMSIYPEPPTTEQLNNELQNGELADPVPLEYPSIDGIQIN